MNDKKKTTDIIHFIHEENRHFLSNQVNQLTNKMEILANISKRRDEFKPRYIYLGGILWFLLLSGIPCSLGIIYILITWVRQITIYSDHSQTLSIFVAVPILSIGVWVGYKIIQDMYIPIRRTYITDEQILNKLYNQGVIESAQINTVKLNDQGTLINFRVDLSKGTNNYKITSYYSSNRVDLKTDDTIMVLKWWPFVIPL